MTDGQSMSMLDLIAGASLVALLIMLLLLALLFLAVWFIIRKHKALRAIHADCELFDDVFWSGKSLDEIESECLDGRFGADGVSPVFLAGNKELHKIREGGVKDPGLIAESVLRAMDSAIQVEVRKLNRHMPFIATVGSVSPYIGLFGTVWGIINAFQSLSTSQQVTLAQVAPGIAEALIATAMGLLAAIPAVVAFNFFAAEIESLSERYERLADQFINIMHRNL